VSGHPFSRDERDPEAPRCSRTAEPISETLFWLWDNGLIEWNGEYRNGRKVWVATEKGETYDGPWEDEAPAGSGT
jgi:hypothetical protein